MRDLNKAQLQNELTRRWGKNGYAELRKGAATKAERDLLRTLYNGSPEASRHRVADRRFSYRCKVGYLSHVLFTAFHVEGSGDTWREAFAEADAKKAAAK